jgi:hypothetical protein
MLGFALIASGIMRLILAFNMKEGAPWLWVVLSGLIALALGVIILIHWPVSGLYILGIFLGVDLVRRGELDLGRLGLKKSANGLRSRFDRPCAARRRFSGHWPPDQRKKRPLALYPDSWA